MHLILTYEIPLVFPAVLRKTGIVM